VSGTGTKIRRRQDSILAAKMWHSGATKTEISEATGIKRELVNSRVILGERLLTLDDPLRPQNERVGTQDEEDLGETCRFDSEET